MQNTETGLFFFFGKIHFVGKTICSAFIVLLSCERFFKALFEMLLHQIWIADNGDAPVKATINWYYEKIFCKDTFTLALRIHLETDTWAALCFPFAVAFDPALA